MTYSFAVRDGSFVSFNTIGELRAFAAGYNTRPHEGLSRNSLEGGRAPRHAEIMASGKHGSQDVVATAIEDFFYLVSGLTLQARAGTKIFTFPNGDTICFENNAQLAAFMSGRKKYERIGGARPGSEVDALEACRSSRRLPVHDQKFVA